MARKKLLHVLYSGQGGLGTYFMNFVNSDQNGNFEHYAFFYGIEPLDEELKHFCLLNNINYRYQLRSGKLDLKAIRLCNNFIRKNRIEYVFLHTFSMSLLTFLAFFNSWKVIAVDHTTHHIKTKIEKIFTMLNHFFADKMVFFYKNQFDAIKGTFPFLCKRKNSIVIAKTVDTNAFKPHDTISENEVFTLGVATRLVKGKLLDLLIQAIYELKKEGYLVRLKIAGQGPEGENMKKLTSSLGLTREIIFTGLLNRNDLIKFYQSLDIYVHPSEGETICYSIMEAQACALPILASNVDGISNYLSKENGGVLFNNTVGGIIEKLKLFYDNEELMVEYSRSSRNAMIELFKKNNNSDCLLSIL
ncbi:glycosyltransferase family 4 protein [Fulvivirga sediminis]|uniref:Glycosyltransferase family 4 protein n=1 Tax=Fulvivirga sediminis TaxID=2803949 RepID=A0A937F5H5_9BACT|nr:glycosyltransferase family 4 protein [Fulvivirga sediminis]MBL3655381.1 glycosyltransferase family 4 protein [Fulvivirga sediminis]